MESKVKIFIVEDDPLMMRMYERVFKLSGYDVELASNGEEALAKFKTMKPLPTLLLLDIMMPKMSGFDVLRQLKANKDWKSVPVVILSNLAGKEDAEKALNLGAVLYLVKSQYSPKEVVEKVKEVIAGYTRGEDIPEVKVSAKELPKKKK